MELPESIRKELEPWNSGAGIDLESWIGCEGRFALAVGYSSIFWPEFVEFDGYLLRKGFRESSLRDWEQRGATRKSTEWTMNHLHIADIQYTGCPDISHDKLIYLGQILREIYGAKLKYQFPDRPCVVEFYKPSNSDELSAYQISFWQKSHDLDA